MIPNISYDEKIKHDQLTDYKLNSALTNACENNNLPLVHYILTTLNADINQWGGKLLMTPLDYACMYGNLKIVEHLISYPGLKKHAWINPQNPVLNTTAKNGHTDILDFIFNHKPFITKHSIQSIFEYAVNQERTHLINYFIFHFKLPFTEDIKLFIYDDDKRWFIHELFEKRELNEKLQNEMIVSSKTESKNKI